MSALPPAGTGQWITPPPVNDGSDVWSGAEYSSARGTDQGPGELFSQADYGSHLGSLNKTAYRASAATPVTYPYYVNYATGPSAALPPYWPQPPGSSNSIQRLAIASLLLALVAGAMGFAPLHQMVLEVAAVFLPAGLSIGYGMAALSRRRICSRSGSALAIAGVSLSVLAIGLAVVGLMVNSLFFRW